MRRGRGRLLYLGTYWAVDNVDHMIKTASIRYITWKYWHAPYLHGLSIAVTAAYDMYLECCEGKLDPEWAVAESHRMSFRKFRLILSEEMLTYDPKNNYYPGDAGLRAMTQQHKARRAGPSTPFFEAGGVTAENFRRAKSAVGSRLCGDLFDLERHLGSVERFTNSDACEVCGDKTAYKCKTCNKHVCVLKNRSWKGGHCLAALHNDLFFGLSRSDFKDVHNKAVKDWEPADEARKTRHAHDIRELKELLETEVPSRNP